MIECPLRRCFLRVVPLLLVVSPAGVAGEAARMGELRDGLAPAEAVAAFTAAEGFKVSLVAAEPEVRQPVAMTIDARGRLWVAEAFSYPNRAAGDEGGDRILIFEDADGDGAFESRKVFAEKLNLVSGLEVGFGGVWVGAAPYLLFLPDRDGNDVPDGPPERLLDGWGYEDTHETLNSFIWGPDGWLYGCHGVFTHSRVGAPGTPDAQRQPINAGVWRFHPETRKFEVFAHGTSNPWGLDFNDHGQAFVTACVIPHLYHILQGGRYQRQAGRHFDPHTYDDLKTIADHRHFAGDAWAASRDGSASDLGGGHAHCGLSIYLGDNFPPEYRGALLFNNLHGHRMNHDAAEPAGSGYIGRHRPDFLYANDKQHMGVALRYGPDGGLFLIDWYDRQTCHLTLQDAWDRSNGRIYKITHGTPPARQVDLARADDAALVKYQLHANDWFVRTARRVLHERKAAGKPLDPAALAGLRELLRHPEDSRRLRGLWTLHATGNLRESDLPGLMEHDASPYVRAWAVQLANESPATAAVVDAMARLAREDAAPQVRLHLAAALQRLPAEKRVGIAAGLLSHAEDAGDPNLPLMLWYGVSDLADAQPEAAMKLALDSRIPLVRRYLFRRLAESAAGRERVLAAASPETAGDVLAAVAQAVADARSLPAPAAWEAAAVVLEKAATGDRRRDFERIATIFGDPRMSGRFRAVLADATAAPADRLAALENLRRLADPELPAALMAAIRAADEPMRKDWLQALGTVSDEGVPAFLLERLPTLSPEETQAAVLTAAATAAGARLLAEALAAGAVERGDISAFAARQMRAHGEPRTGELLTEHWGAISETGADKSAEMKRYEEMLTPAALAGADLRHGRELYRASCHACHSLFGDGGAIGPDLTGSNRGNLHYLLENILSPGAVVGIDYQLHSVTTRDGRVLAGVLRGKSAEAITLGMAGGPDTTVRMDEIREHRISPVSMMPEGLLGNLPPEGVRDLIAYLQSPRQVPLPSEREILIDDAAFTAAATGGEVRTQDMGGFPGDSWSSGRQLWWTGGQPGDRLSVRFEVPAADRYEVFGVFTRAHDYGIVSLRLNGAAALDSLDLFQKSGVTTTGEIPLGTHTLGAGPQELEVEIRGHHPEATPLRMFGLDHLRLVPVAER